MKMESVIFKWSEDFYNVDDIAVMLKEVAVEKKELAIAIESEDGLNYKIISEIGVDCAGSLIYAAAALELNLENCLVVFPDGSFETFEDILYDVGGEPHPVFITDFVKELLFRRSNN